MFDFKKLSDKYNSDAPFNKLVNVFMSLIEEHGFQPSEIREGLFFAQYKFEMYNAREVIRTDREWEEYYRLCDTLKKSF